MSLEAAEAPAALDGEPHSRLRSISFPDTKADPRRVAFSLTSGEEPPYRYGQGGGPMTIFWSTCAWLAFAAVALATDVTTCYQTIAARDIAVLQTDLDCSMVPGAGPDVVLERGALLQLNGHRLLGGHIGVGSDPGGRRVIIEGPGEISGMTGCGISAQGPA